MSGTAKGAEAKSVGLLALGLGLVGFDRFMIMPMFPVLQRDLGLSYQDLGLITGSLAVSWGLFSIFAGSLTDRIGTRKVVVGSIILFSLIGGASGLAVGLGSMVAIRILIGAFEGAYAPAALVATLKASEPAHHGRNVGIQQAALPLFGLALAPLLVTQMLTVVPWRWIFALVTLPGLLIAFGLYKTLRPMTLAESAAHTTVRDTGTHAWRDLFRYRNIRLNIVAMFCWLNCIIVLTALLPGYLSDFLHLTLPRMGIVLSGLGFGATLGDLVMPWLSDFIGRKTVAVIDILGTATGLVIFARSGADVWVLFACLFIAAFFLHNLIGLTTGPLSVEAVPPALMNSASGLVIGLGEIFGGGLAPILAGFVAQHFGIQYILHLAIGGLAIGLVVVLSLRETGRDFSLKERRSP